MPERLHQTGSTSFRAEVDNLMTGSVVLPARGTRSRAERLSMRKIREVLPLKHACSASVRTIARSVGIGHTDGGRISAPDGGNRDHLAGAARFRAGATAVCPGRFQQAAGADHARVEPRVCRAPPARRDPPLAREEYRAEHPDGYGYSGSASSTSSGAVASAR